MFPALTGPRLQLAVPARQVLFAAVYFALCWAGQKLTLAPESGVALWPASGFFLAVLLRSPPGGQLRWIVPGVAVDILASVFLFDFPVPLAVAIAGGNTLEAWSGAALLRRFDRDFRLRNTQDALAFSLLAGCIAPLASMALGGTVVAVHTSTPLLESWRLWWTGDAVGMVTVAPLLITLGPGHWARLRSERMIQRVDAVALLAAVLALGHLCLGQSSPVAFFTLPLVIWAALRYGVVGSSAVSAMLLVQGVLYARAGAGPFAVQLPLLAAQSALQGFGIVTALTGLVLAVTVGETRRLKQQAEQEVILRTAELRQREIELGSVLADLQQVDRRKDHFLAALAHELLNPIAALSNGLALLDKGLPRAQDDSVRVMMKRQLGLLTTLVKDLLELARIKSGKVHLQLRATALSALVNGAVAAVQERMAQKAQVLHVELPDTEIHFLCDEKRLMQVVHNLLANAHRHCPPGTQVHVRGWAEEDGVKVSVRDDGPGIPEHQLARIFVRYEQLEGHPDEGLGLGLALARQLVELHDGRLEVQSVVGSGTTFVMALPGSLRPGPGE